VCDCTAYGCNCAQVLNCNTGSAIPMLQNCTFNCGNCDCTCDDCSSNCGSDNCYCDCTDCECAGSTCADCQRNC
jgi:hypothetical protein